MLIKNVKEITKENLGALLDITKKSDDFKYKLYDRYKAGQDGTPILTRDYYIGDVKQVNKINNRVNNDFFGEIVDRKVGFFCGNPITYDLRYKDENESLYDKNIEFIKHFNDVNSVEDNDAEITKACAIAGTAARLFYFDADGEIKFRNVNAWEYFVVGDEIDSPVAACYHYKQYEYDSKGEAVEVEIAEVYDSVNVTKYKRIVDHNGTGKIEEIFPPVQHKFTDVPFVVFINNEELQGDGDKVLSLIDMYDRLVSDIDNELEQTRLAYMVFYGGIVNDETLERMKRTGAFSFPDVDGKAEFLVKNINDVVYQNQLKLTMDNIYKFSSTPNLSDEQFAGNASGVALKYKFLSFEDKCKVFQNKFTNSLRRQFSLLSEIWNIQGGALDIYDMKFVYTRNYPQNLLEEADILSKLKGIVSEQTAFGLMSFITNPNEEIEALDEEKQKNVEMFGNPLDMEKEDEETEEKEEKDEDIQK